MPQSRQASLEEDVEPPQEDVDEATDAAPAAEDAEGTTDEQN